MPASRRKPPARKPPPNRSGVHFLCSGRVVDGLIESCDPGPADLVVELGAGFGAITASLVRTGARVIAVERDPEFARKLSNRLANTGRVRVVPADARTVPLPRKRFLVVASIPYSISTALLRRLLGPRSTAMRRAALIVEWGFAKRLTASVPRNKELAWWAARFQIEIVRRVPARCFRPEPSVDSAQLLIRRREGLGGETQNTLLGLLDAAYREPLRPVRHTARQAGLQPRRDLRRYGIDPAAPAATVSPAQWAAMATELARARNSKASRGRSSACSQEGGRI